MAQVSKTMLGLSNKDSIKFMESELTRMGSGDHDAIAMGIIMAHMLVKQATKAFRSDWTNKACVAEMKQIHMQKTFVPNHWHKLTAEQKARIVKSFIFVTKRGVAR